MLDLDLIRIDGGTQSRVELNQETVAEYCEAYKAGANMPPVIVFYDGTDRWLADGFHRYLVRRPRGSRRSTRTSRPARCVMPSSTASGPMPLMV